jgi:tetratricopeptide (TPR) repeat protein
MLRKLAQIIFLLLVFSPGFAQNIELLEKRLSDIKTDTVLKIELLNILSREYTFINSKRSLDYASQALDLSKKSGNSIGMAYSYRNLSGIYTLNEMYFQAMDFIQEAISIFNAKGDSSGVANCYISLAYLYRKLNNIDDELYFNRKAFNDFVQMDIPERIGVTAHNLGESFLNAGKLDSARILISFAIRINDSINNLSVLSSCYRVLGTIEYECGNLGPAGDYFRKVLDISDELGMNSQKTATVESSIYLARIYHETSM